MSLMVMKFYSPEFKVDAVTLYLSDLDLTLAGVAKDLGIRGHAAGLDTGPPRRAQHHHEHDQGADRGERAEPGGRAQG
ncbi:transposase [Streptomyces sp. NBRC 110611]|nr:transposase [Streptomyces sp. NBRC 110611]